MTKLKRVLLDYVPRDWKMFSCAMLCLVLGYINIQTDTIYNHLAALLVATTAGFCIFGSIWKPHYEELAARFQQMTKKWEEVQELQPEAMGKRMAAAFRQEVSRMQACGELPADAHIVVEVGNSPERRPPPGRRLN